MSTLFGKLAMVLGMKQEYTWLIVAIVAGLIFAGIAVFMAGARDYEMRKDFEKW